jgi:hypothetical protein
MTCLPAVFPDRQSKHKKLNVPTLLAVIHFQVFLLDEQLREIAERSQAGSFMEAFLTYIAQDSGTPAALHSLVLAIKPGDVRLVLRFWRSRELR